MERKRNRKVKRETIEAAALRLLDRAGINGEDEARKEQAAAGFVQRASGTENSAKDSTA